jgi:Spy/CpxP family protein refolding chaperone
MHRMFRFFTRRRALGALGIVLLLGSTLGLQGCFRGHWHGRYDPARFDEHLNDIQADIADELKITDAQKPAFDALMAQYRQVARQWRDGWHETGLDVKQALEREPTDAAAVGGALKRRIHQRPDDATLERLIDESVAFYNTLSPEQQLDVRDRMLRHLRRRLG